jgi:hypothetical protein
MGKGAARRMKYLDYDYLRSTGKVPHWFGLGFIQLKLTDDTRMHFWHPEYRQNVPLEELHNHRYDFHSEVLLGRITHEVHDVWEAQNDGDCLLVQVSCDPDKPAPFQPRIECRTKQTGSYTMGCGSCYDFPHFGFHRVITPMAATLLTRGPVVKEYATVLRPKDVEAVCPFSDPKPEEECWRLIKDIL